MENRNVKKEGKTHFLFVVYVFNLSYASFDCLTPRYPK